MVQRGWLDGGVVREKTFVAKFARHATHEREVRRHDKFAHAHRHTRRCRTNNSRSVALLAPLTVDQPPADAEPALPPHSGYPLPIVQVAGMTPEQLAAEKRRIAWRQCALLRGLTKDHDGRWRGRGAAPDGDVAHGEPTDDTSLSVDSFVRAAHRQEEEEEEERRLT